MKIGKLEPVKLRDVWANEEYDFSAWMASNLESLSDAVGLNLELSAVEKRIEGTGYEIDLLCTDDDGDSVIIENQLERTDHSHLGQILTYAVNMDAPTVIWVARDPRQEHANVVNWLNENTDRGFYLVKVEAYRIDNSNPAPLFTVICAPSEDVKKLGSGKKQLAFDQGVQKIRKLHADTIIVPARKEGFDKVFLGENAWYSIRIKESKIPDLKYVASYQVSPISAITHVAKIKEIITSDTDPDKFKILFEGKAKEIKQIPLGKRSKIQSIAYCDHSMLDQVGDIDELLSVRLEKRAA